MIHAQAPPRWWLAWHLLTNADRPCPASPRVQIEAMLARIAYEHACIAGDWNAAALALSAVDVYRMLGAERRVGSP